MVANITRIQSALKFLGKAGKTPPFLISALAGDDLAESSSSNLTLGKKPQWLLTGVRLMTNCLGSQSYMVVNKS
jgi:hypothetical protein